MLLAKEAWQLTKDSLAQQIIKLETKIKEEASKGLTSVRLQDGVWNSDVRYQPSTITLVRAVMAAGYKISYTGSQDQITEISWSV